MTAHNDKNKENNVIINDRPQSLVSFEWAIRRVLRHEANRDIVEGFLSELLRQPVRIVKFLENVSPDSDPLARSESTYMITEDENGKFVLTELTFTLEQDYLRRMLYGMCRTLVEQADQMSIYMPIKKVCSIAMIYLDTGRNTDYLSSGKMCFTGVYKEGTLNFTDMQRKMYSEIEAGNISSQYYILKRNKFADIPENALEEWLYFLKYREIKDSFSATGLLKARDVLRYDHLSDEEREDYDHEQNTPCHPLSEAVSIVNLAKYEEERRYAPIIEANNRTFMKRINLDKEYYNALKEQDKVREEIDKACEERDNAVEESSKEIEVHDNDFKERDRSIKERIKALEEKNEEIAERLKEIEEQKRLYNII
jgi:hypothetical protein